MQDANIAAWRKETRARLIADRAAMAPAAQAAASAAIGRRLETVLGEVSGAVVGAYWPFRGEPDLRGWITRLDEAGGRAALPVIVAKGEPLIFRLWRPGEPLIDDRFKIPIPEHGTQALPDIVIAPLVGFDRALYRLGYGGGFYDRTLASFPKRPRFIGVGYSGAELATTYPQAHDIPLDAIVTETEMIGG